VSRKELKVSVNPTEFIAFVETIYKVLDRGLKSIGYLKCEGMKNINEKIDEIKKNPEKILDEILEFYKRIIEFSATYNYYTFFLQLLRQIPWECAKRAYPKIENIKPLLERFGLKECS